VLIYIVYWYFGLGEKNPETKEEAKSDEKSKSDKGIDEESTIS
jgi:hypothetical protein